MNTSIISNSLLLMNILIILSKNNFISSYIILPFNFSSKKTKNNENPKEYFEYYINNTIYSKIEINNSPIDFKISMEKLPIFISKKIYKNQNFNTDDNKYSLNYLNIKEAFLINDSFNLVSAQINSPNTNIFINNNLSFFLVNEFNDSNLYEDDEIGLNRVKENQNIDIKNDIDIKDYSIEEKANLIFQLKKKDLINSTLFSIKYNY